MPHKPKKPCAFQGCPNLTYGKYCDEHKNLETVKYEYSPDHNKKYGERWRQIRERYVLSHPLCERCLKEGRTTPVDEVHHILPLNRGGTNDESNLMSVCRSCHNKLHIEMGDRHRWGK